ncbi:hypothetical protein CC86DRAFT_367286 [Ophiobolus disseminans]|uniref:S-adenosyl-L-methionine-dependent methyltransferase n=1 Tax=Ophiobolus disseminans TaxID=1469910 RepID=A0A6A7AB70_9PLEO|nr:hypothetical protein CC86DRAFT_367286 [Ophiobolus disseminans]
MTLQLITYVLDTASIGAAVSVLPRIIFGFDPVPPTIYDKLGLTSDVYGAFCSGLLLLSCLKWALRKWWRKAHGGEKESMYGLQHGRLHLKLPTPMWMNMGYWGHEVEASTMAEACRDLLKMVLREAGFSSEVERAEIARGTRRPKVLIDLGFGCGDQTIYLMSDTSVRSCDREWWDEREYCPKFDHYIGITKDATQHRYARKRVEELIGHGQEQRSEPNISLFCADAATPGPWTTSWNKDIKSCIEDVLEVDPDRWVLALDTIYHFSPSRWPLIKYAHAFQASFMAFDLCLSPQATRTQRIILRILTALMGAPWANFVTPVEYRRKLVEAGYPTDEIKIVDVSEHVFAPLARYLEEQDARLKMLGLGIGSFSVAKYMFNWWGSSGVVRGVIVVARR